MSEELERMARVWSDESGCPIALDEVTLFARRVRNAALDEAAGVANGFTCGICGMDGKAAAAILALKEPT